jgi:hypothetical protein
MTRPQQVRLANEPLFQVSPQASRAGIPGHDVQFYDSEAFLATTVAAFLGDGFRAGQPAIVIATEAHRREFDEQLTLAGIDLDEVRVDGSFVVLDARQTLDCFMEGKTPNRELFEATVGHIFETVLRDRRYLVVRAYGEMVDLLWKDGNVEGALALEDLWNEIAAKYSFSLLCAYSMGNFVKEAHTEGFRRICHQHQRVIPTESYLQANETDRLRQISLLEQKARTLEADLTALRAGLSKQL